MSTRFERARLTKRIAAYRQRHPEALTLGEAEALLKSLVAGEPGRPMPRAQVRALLEYVGVVGNLTPKEIARWIANRKRAEGGKKSGEKRRRDSKIERCRKELAKHPGLTRAQLRERGFSDSTITRAPKPR